MKVEVREGTGQEDTLMAEGEVEALGSQVIMLEATVPVEVVTMMAGEAEIVKEVVDTATVKVVDMATVEVVATMEVVDMATVEVVDMATVGVAEIVVEVVDTATVEMEEVKTVEVEQAENK